MEHQEADKTVEAGGSRKHRILRKIVFACLILSVFIVVAAAAIAYNNISLWSDKAFAVRLDIAAGNAEKWLQEHRQDILEKRNAPLLMMLRECNDLKANQTFSGIVASFLNEPMTHYSRCLKRWVDPNRPVIESELNQAISGKNLDNKWFLCAIAPQDFSVKLEELGLFDPWRWHRRQLTHQILALITLRDRHGSSERLDKLLEGLCERTRADMTFCIPVVDIYIQRAAFVLRAGFPQKVRRRWIERIIAEQQSDGGWNDRWLCFTTARRNLVFDFNETPSDQHATIQAIYVLYLVKYRYPEQFGLKQPR